MPYYIVNGLRMHIKFGGRKKPPAPCVAQVERKGRKERCCGLSTMLCDWPLESGGTCDAPLCHDHAKEVGRDRHLCPIHLPLLHQQPGLFEETDGKELEF